MACHLLRLRPTSGCPRERSRRRWPTPRSTRRCSTTRRGLSSTCWRSEGMALALQLYLDDCANSATLARMLREAGHQVVTPAESGIAGADDGDHLGYAILHNLTLVT